MNYSNRIDVNDNNNKSCGDNLLEIGFFCFFDIGSGFGFSGGQNFSLFACPRFLYFSLKLFLGFSLGVFLWQDGQSSESVIWLEFDKGLLIIINKCKTNRSATTEGCPESEEDDVLHIPFVLTSEKILKLGQ